MLVKGLRRRPLTAKTGVRFPYKLLIIMKSLNLFRFKDFFVVKRLGGGEIIKETFGHLGNEQYALMAYQVARYHHEKLVEIFLESRVLVEKVHKNGDLNKK